MINTQPLRAEITTNPAASRSKSPRCNKPRPFYWDTCILRCNSVSLLGLDRESSQALSSTPSRPGFAILKLPHVFLFLLTELILSRESSIRTRHLHLRGCTLASHRLHETPGVQDPTELACSTFRTGKPIRCTGQWENSRAYSRPDRNLKVSERTPDGSISPPHKLTRIAWQKIISRDNAASKTQSYFRTTPQRLPLN